MKGIWLIILLLALLSSLPAEAMSPEAFAQQVHREINAIRVRNGLHELLWLDDLAGLALLHSTNMGCKGFFDHIDLEGKQISQRQKEHYPELLLAGIGENLFYIENSRKVFDPKDIALGWMNSPGHRDNILKAEFTHEGIGVFLQDNKLYTAQVFAVPILKRLSALPQTFCTDQCYQVEFEYLSPEPRASFECQLAIPDSTTKIKLDVLTYQCGSMPLELVWKDDSRLTIPMQFKYGKGTYILKVGWDGYFYSDMLEFRVE